MSVEEQSVELNNLIINSLYRPTKELIEAIKTYIRNIHEIAELEEKGFLEQGTLNNILIAIKQDIIDRDLMSFSFDFDVDI